VPHLQLATSADVTLILRSNNTNSVKLFTVHVLIEQSKCTYNVSTRNVTAISVLRKTVLSGSLVDFKVKFLCSELTRKEGPA
jgi:hypothetical protein